MQELIVLDKTTPSVKYLCEKDKRLAKVISIIGTIEYTAHDDDPYAFLIHEIIEQMLSVKAGRQIYNRLIELCDGFMMPEKINQLSDEQIKSIGTSWAKVGYIKNITNAVLEGDLSFDELISMSDFEVMRKLLSIKGIGAWTAKMYLIFVLDRQDILPYEDVAFIQAFCWMHKTEDRSKELIMNKCKKWKPYSSIAARYLYQALDSGLTKEEFHLHK